ncbi:sodium:solute symporter family transporter [Rubellicoccus peritrichatus]|uniref:Na+:solute symporter n=1 Tax=Rubellicoccus peritrichatus TaxID=3080537 RepID=A0AAQ3QXE7_9BACT|nr:hypothetical protein [Puniceicoccus sp. CR14]WOO43608.1 hypothetical protein RZN69_10960 [Puniceicoccus sp. CR14]
MILLDYIVLVCVLLFVLCIGLLFAKRGGADSDSFMLSGRDLPWWLSGMSLSANDFNADTPIHNSRRARELGIPGTWLYWRIPFGQCLTAIFTKWARRSGIKTPVELMQLRYGGKIGRAIRIWKVFYSTLFQGTFALAVGLLAFRKLAQVLLDYPETVSAFGIAWNMDVVIMVGAVVVAMSYSITAGLWGVVATDFVEFMIALGCSWVLTMFVLNEVGGGAVLYENLIQSAETTGVNFLDWTPTLTLAVFIFLFIQPLGIAGEGCINIRCLAARDERHGMLAQIWQPFSNLVLRSWPWWIAGMASIYLVTDIADPELAYPEMIQRFMPIGLKGLMVAGFFCAFISTIDTILHTSSAVVLNDFYRPYVKPDASERHYVMVLRLAIVIFAALGIYLATQMESVLGVLFFTWKVGGAMAMMAGLRWIWWRVSGWSELFVVVFSLPITVLIEFDNQICNWMGFKQSPTDIIEGWFGVMAGSNAMEGKWAIEYILGLVVIMGIAVLLMYIAPKDNTDHIVQFYKKARPLGLWGPIQKIAGVGPVDSYKVDLGVYLSSSFGIMLATLSVGMFFFQQWTIGFLLLIGSAVLFYCLLKLIPKSVHTELD